MIRGPTRQVGKRAKKAIVVDENHVNNVYKLAELVKDKEEEYLRAVEKLFYLLLELYEKNENPKLNFNPRDLLTQFVEKVNEKGVEAFNKGDLKLSQKELSRVFELLHQDKIVLAYKDPNALMEAQVLTYGNLSCVFRKASDFQKAIKIVDYTIELEEKLSKVNHGKAGLSIISTYLNKAAMLSEGKKHQEAYQAIQKALERIQVAEMGSNIDEGQSSYLKFMRLNSLKNCGKQLLLLKQKEMAIEHYEKALEIAKELKRGNLVAKLEEGIQKLRSSSND